MLSDLLGPSFVSSVRYTGSCSSDFGGGFPLRGPTSEEGTCPEGQC